MKILQRIGLCGYLGLLLLIPLWFYVSGDKDNTSSIIIWFLYWLPLWPPLIGIIKGKIYTNAWSAFIAALYACHGLTLALTTNYDLRFAVLELVLALMMFFGNSLYVRAVSHT